MVSAAQRQLDGFLAKYDPAIAKQAKSALKKMRTLLPGAVELVYDNYNALAIAFGTGEKLGDVLFSIAVYPRWVSLFFAKASALKDPTQRLEGSGKKMKHIVLRDGAATLEEPDVRALIEEVLDLEGRPFSGGRGRLVIKSISAKQRPRR